MSTYPETTVYMLNLCGRSETWGNEVHSPADGTFDRVPREGDTVTADDVPHVVNKIFSVRDLDGEGQVYEVLAWASRLADDPHVRLEKQLKELRGVITELAWKFNCSGYDPGTGMEPSSHAWNQNQINAAHNAMDALGDGLQALLDKVRHTTYTGGFAHDPDLPLLDHHGPATPYSPPSPSSDGGASPIYN